MQKDDLTFDSLAFLRLLQLADSALPIGSAAHSFGLETLTDDEDVRVEDLETFFSEYLTEAGKLECAFCLNSHQIALRCMDALPTYITTYIEEWLQLNMHVSAYKPARESRAASATLGRRFLQLVATLHSQETVSLILMEAKRQQVEIHYCTAFGVVGGLLGVGVQATGLAYLQQTLGTLISAAQRLLPLGQSQAGTLQWHLKPLMIDIVASSMQAAVDLEQLTAFTPLLDMGSMRHPTLTTRLFIS